MDQNQKKLVSLITQTIHDKKGFNILALDIREVSSLTDTLIVAEGNVDRHVIAIAKAIEEKMKKIGEKPVYIEGLDNGDWIVMDYFNVIIHIFMPGLREKYQLERLWSEGSLMDLDFESEEQRSFAN